jgi:hypothetical protein
MDMERFMRRWHLVGILLAMVSLTSTAVAQNVRKTAEGSMLVTGSVEVNPDGTLHGYSLDQAEKLPPEVVDVIGKNIATWEFKLSGATKEVVKAKMHLRVVAKPAGDGKYMVGIAGSSFGDSGEGTPSITAKDRLQPKYPQLAIASRVSGTVYLLLRVGRDGTVEDAIAEQVNLEQYATPMAMEKLRNAFAKASLDAARHWTYNLPTTGKTANDPYWVVRVPVAFYLNVNGSELVKHSYGRWDAYIPGPRQTAPWINKELASQSPDTTPDGSLATGNSPIQLATQLGGT